MSEEKERRYRALLLKLCLSLAVLGSTAAVATSAFAFASTLGILQLESIGLTTVQGAKVQLGLRNYSTKSFDYYDQLTADSFKASWGNSIAASGYYPVSSSFKSKWFDVLDTASDAEAFPKFTKEYDTNDTGTAFPGNEAQGISGWDLANGFIGANAYDTAKSHYLQMELSLYRPTDDNPFPIEIYVSDLAVNADTSKNTSNLSAANAKAQAVNPKNAVTVEQLNKIEDCVRVSILTDTYDASSQKYTYSYTIIDPHKDGTTAYAGRLNVKNSDSYYDTYANDSTKEALYGEYAIANGSSTLPDALWNASSATDSSLTDTSADPSAFNAETQANVRPLNIEKTDANGVKLINAVSEDTKTVDEVKATDSKGYPLYPIATLDSGESQRIVISYYIEGWDKDVINTVEYASFTSLLTLNGVYIRDDR
jgi:hypothetical protein